MKTTPTPRVAPRAKRTRVPARAPIATDTFEQHTAEVLQRERATFAEVAEHERQVEILRWLHAQDALRRRGHARMA